MSASSLCDLLVLRHVQAATQPPQHLRSTKPPSAAGLTVSQNAVAEICSIFVRPPGLRHVQAAPQPPQHLPNEKGKQI